MPDDPKTAALAQIAALVAQREELIATLERQIVQQIAAARQERIHWKYIATALTPPGAKPLARSNVQRKYEPLIEEQVTVTVRETEA